MQTCTRLATGYLLVMTGVFANVYAADFNVYSVTGTNGTGLNMRSGPSTSNSIVTKIPADGYGIVATGEERKVGNATWAKVYWTDKGGWVNKAYLKLSEAATPAKPNTPKPPANNTSRGSTVIKCTGTEPFWSITISEQDVNVDMVDGLKYSVPVRLRQTSANNTKIAVIAGQDTRNETQMFLQKVEACSDGMSDKRYPFAITALLNKQRVISGCCNAQ
ncbi:MAG: SH3 domain-containing protein [Thiothrix sp.]